MMYKIAVIGLGYVGLPVALSFAKHFKVIAYDVDNRRIRNLSKGIDVTGESKDTELKNEHITFTNNSEEIAFANVFIITVPTPISDSNQPDLSYLKSASLTVAKYLKKSDVVVYESTVYPGVTEDFCGSLLEAESGLQSGKDFFLAYSPERINPGASQYKLKDIVKVVSAQNSNTLEKVASLYEKIIDAGVYKAKSIKVAEAAKVIENTQRDINIAFMNELNIIFDKLDINIYDVLDAAKTKWNFVDFKPGLVGGHCIGVDPYYLAYKSSKVGYRPEVILAGRHINNAMPKYYASQLVKKIIREKLDLSKCRVGILGITFKENCPDIRNSKVIDMIREIESYGIQYYLFDPIADTDEVKIHYGLQLSSLSKMDDCNVFVIPVAHSFWSQAKIASIIKKRKIIYNIKDIHLDDASIQINAIESVE